MTRGHFFQIICVILLIQIVLTLNLNLIQPIILKRMYVGFLSMVPCIIALIVNFKSGLLEISWGQHPIKWLLIGGIGTFLSIELLAYVNDLIYQIVFMKSFPQVQLDESMELWSAVMIICFNIPFVIFEEITWRGYLYRSIDIFGIKNASLLTSFFWGIWHVPLNFFGLNDIGNLPASIMFTIVFCTLFGQLLVFVRAISNGILCCVVIHSLLNAFVLFPHTQILESRHILINIIGLPTIALLICINSLFIINWRWRSAKRVNKIEF